MALCPPIFPRLFGSYLFGVSNMLILKLLQMQNPTLEPSPCYCKEDNRKDLYHLDIPQYRCRLSRYNIRPFSLQNLSKISPYISCNRKVFFFCSSSFFCLKKTNIQSLSIKVKTERKIPYTIILLEFFIFTIGRPYNFLRFFVKKKTY